MDYYLRTDIKYTKEDKENYKKLKEQKEIQEVSNQEWQLGDWEYHWFGNGMLKSVRKPDGSLVSFEYDALGRRISKTVGENIKRFLWDGNVLLHEWNLDKKEKPRAYLNDLGELIQDKAEPINNLVTWIYEERTFVPSAKIINEETYSIVNDYLGTPIQAYNSKGILIWERELDIYGKLRNLQGEKSFIPFRFAGQYYDVETDLCYQRFRYYDPNTGNFISQDPIGLLGNNPTMYGYVYDTNAQVDIFGLDCSNLSKRKAGGTGKDYDKINGQGIYVLRDPITGDIKYVGRGDAPARGLAHSASADKGSLVQEIIHDNNLTKAEAKHIEQRLINQLGGAKSQNANTSLLNQIRSYSPSNPNAGKYDIAGISQGHADAIWQQTITKLGL